MMFRPDFVSYPGQTIMHPERDQPMTRCYILCTTPRSGSTLLCKLLAATGRMGDPDSFYHRAAFMRDWAVAWGLAETDPAAGAAFDAAYLAAAIRAGEAGTGRFGMRLQRSYLPLLSATLDRLYPGLPSDRLRFERAFGDLSYLHLSRQDKVAQAVSLVKAEQSGLWHRNADGSELERLAEAREVAYDFRAIHHAVLALQDEDEAWGAWFARERITPLLLSYETFVRQPAETVREICRSLDVTLPETEELRPGLAKLADAVSLDWISRYKAERAAQP